MSKWELNGTFAHHQSVRFLKFYVPTSIDIEALQQLVIFARHHTNGNTCSVINLMVSKSAMVCIITLT